MRLLAIALALCLILPPPVEAESIPLADALPAPGVEDFKKGLAADNNGDSAQAAFWYRKAAEQGHMDAQHFLGFMYANGKGVPPDGRQAVFWYRKAAEQGDADAKYNLGVMYRDGQRVPQDYSEAVSWFRGAAEQGQPLAQTNLGQMYAEGWGVPQDFVLAHMWYNLAAAQGISAGAENRQRIAQRMTRAQVEKAQGHAREWLAAHPN